MTNPQATEKAKEIIESYWAMFIRHEFDQRTPWFDQWLATPEGSRLIGELVEGWAVETLKEVSKLLVKYHSQIGETEVGNHCFNIIREAVFANKAKGFPDNITDKIN